MKATGEFVVELKPVAPYAQGVGGVQIGRMSLEKQFSGDLTATSKGEMLSAMTAAPGSAGYVVIEQVQGTLAGKVGSFVLQHFGIMDKGNARLILEVVPDSGSADLSGLSGNMAIIIEDGKHLYEFEYDLA